MREINSSEIRTYDKAFISVSFAGVILIAAEMILQSFGKRLCETEGCRLISQYVRFGDTTILVIGICIFMLLAVLALLRARSNKLLLDKLVNLVLITALACEGFFTGYQAFRLFVPCIFCLVVLLLLVVLGIIRILSGAREVIAGFASFLGIFLLFYLVLPSGNIVKLPQEPLILFYSKECKHCDSVMKEIEKINMKIPHLLSSDYPGFLKSVGIEYVPVLFVNNKLEKVFIVGETKISDYLFGKEKREKEPKKKSPVRKKVSKENIKTTPPAIDLFSPKKETPLSILDKNDEGICGENVKCD
jgi:hypothetical protein